MSWRGSYLVREGVESPWMSAYFWVHRPLLSICFVFTLLPHLCLQSCTTELHRTSFPCIQDAQVVLIPSLPPPPQCFWHTGDERGGASAPAVTVNVSIWMRVSYMSVLYIVLSFPSEYSCCLLQRLFNFIVTAIQTAECMFSFTYVSLCRLLHSAQHQLPVHKSADVYVNAEQLGRIPSFPSFCLLSSIPPSPWSVQTPHNLDLDSQILISTATFPLYNYPASLILMSPYCLSYLQHCELETHLPLWTTDMRSTRDGRRPPRFLDVGFSRWHCCRVLAPETFI